MADQTVGNNKAVAAGVSGAIVILLAWILDQFFHIQPPAEVIASVQTLATTALVYIVPHGGNQ